MLNFYNYGKIGCDIMINEFYQECLLFNDFYKEIIIIYIIKVIK